MEEKVPAGAEIREALYDLQRYLSDSIAPLMMADSMDALVRQPPQLTAQHINGWVSSQNRGPGAGVPLSDYFFHALKKIYLLGEYELLPRDLMMNFVRELGRQLVVLCPVEDRELLLVNVERLAQAESVVSSNPEFLYRQAGSQAAPLAARGTHGGPGRGEGREISGDVARGIRSFTSLLGRLQRNTAPLAGSGASGGPSTATVNEEVEIVPQLMALAATSSRSAHELEAHLDQLRKLGIDPQGGSYFRQLSNTLPEWTMSLPRELATVAPEPSAVEAMRRIVVLAENPEEGAARFREMVMAAIDQFNAGSIARSATMFQLALRIVNEKQVDDLVVQAIRKRSHDQLDPEKLRQFAESPDKYGPLRDVLNFFELYTPQGLLSTVRVEEKRDRRRLALALLEAHGADARIAAYEWLQTLIAETNAPPEPYFQRNLVYLMRRIPAPEEVDWPSEVEAVSALAAPPLPLFLVKEAIAYLGSAKHESAEKALLRLAALYERTLLRGGDSSYEPTDLVTLLDRTISALARFGSVGSARAVVGHGLKRQPKLGDTVARLTDLGSHDLSGDPETVELLVKTVRDELPMKVLGFVIRRKSETVSYLIEALSGTPAPQVRELFEEIADRFTDRPFGQAAAKALESFGASPRPAAAAAAASLSGDLELFGLPNLLQSLSEAAVSGLLTLRDSQGEVTGHIALEEGKLLDAQQGGIRGVEAVFAMFERPTPGAFAFVTRRDSVKGSDDVAREVIPIVFEAMRRYDEYRQARVIVPDTARFEVTGIRGSSHPDEQDPGLVRTLWQRVESGASANDCETDVPADPYRVRRQLLHWVDEGSLQLI